jgi:hypothetical protein
MAVAVHIRKHEAVTDCGSFEVYYSDERESRFFHFEDIPSRRLRPEQVDRATALERAKEFAREERDKLR